MQKSKLKEIIRSLSPTQRRILKFLVFYESLTTNEIARNLDMDWRTAKAHLRILEKRGLVASKKVGKEKAIIKARSRHGTREMFIDTKKIKWAIKLAVAEKLR